MLFSLSCQFLSRVKESVCWFLLLFFHALHLTSRVKNRPQFPVCHLCVSVVCICKSCVELTLPLLAFTEGIIMESCCFIFQWNRLLQQKNAKKRMKRRKKKFLRAIACIEATGCCLLAWICEERRQKRFLFSRLYINTLFLCDRGNSQTKHACRIESAHDLLQCVPCKYKVHMCVWSYLYKCLCVCACVCALHTTCRRRVV